MPEVSTLPPGVAVDTDVVLFTRPAQTGQLVPYGFQETVKDAAETWAKSLAANYGIPLDPQGQVRAIYDISLPLTPKIKIIFNGYTLFSLDLAGNLTCKGTITQNGTL